MQGKVVIPLRLNSVCSPYEMTLGYFCQIKLTYVLLLQQYCVWFPAAQSPAVNSFSTRAPVLGLPNANWVSASQSSCLKMPVKNLLFGAELSNKINHYGNTSS